VDFIVSVRAMVDLFFVKAIKNFNKFIYLLNYVLINDVFTDFVYIMWCWNPVGKSVKGRSNYISEGCILAFADGKFLS